MTSSRVAKWTFVGEQLVSRIGAVLLPRAHVRYTATKSNTGEEHGGEHTDPLSC